MSSARLTSIHLLSVFSVTDALCFTRQKPTLAGDYAVSLESMHVSLHLVAGGDGTLTGTVDSPDQHVFGEYLGHRANL